MASIHSDTLNPVDGLQSEVRDLRLARRDRIEPIHRDEESGEGFSAEGSAAASEIDLLSGADAPSEAKKPINAAVRYLTPPLIPARSPKRQPSVPLPLVSRNRHSSVASEHRTVNSKKERDQMNAGTKEGPDAHTGYYDNELGKLPFLWDEFHRNFGPMDQDPFVARAFLGQGTMGMVDEVSPSNGIGSTYVRKRILLPKYARKQKLKVVQQEVAILKMLAHCHIVQLLGTYEAEIQPNRPSSYCLIMSPVGDGDLNAFLHQFYGRDGPSRTVGHSWLQQWFICLSSALHYMHGQGVRHQDIKPSNIIHRGDKVFFTDFSSSVRFEVGETTSTENPARASAMYAAPEVIERFLEDGTLQRHGLGSDIFALGGVFCEMLTVLADKEVSTFNDHLKQYDDVTPNSQGASPLYHQKLDGIDEWFASFRAGVNRTVAESEVVPLFHPYDIYTCCIKPMMAEKRESRCNTATLLKNLESSTKFGLVTSSCPCYK